MDQNPPQGSNIEITSYNNQPNVIIPHDDGSFIRYPMAAFLLFWLGGWFMGFTSVTKEIMSGKGNAFIIFWLGGWTIGGIFAAYFFYRLVRKPVPEQLLFNKPNLSFDTGIPPYKMHFSLFNQKEYWKSIFPKRVIHEFTNKDINTLALRETSSGNRLTIDKGAERIDIATSASEIEREWLFNYIKQNYS